VYVAYLTYCNTVFQILRDDQLRLNNLYQELKGVDDELMKLKKIKHDNEDPLGELENSINEKIDGKLHTRVFIVNELISVPLAWLRIRRMLFCFYSGFWPSFLTDLLSLRLVGAAEARNYVRSSFSQCSA